MADGVVVVDGRRLRPPRRTGDCTCLFCALFRARRLWLPAIFVPLGLVVTGVFTWRVWSAGLAHGSQIVGALLLVVTGLVVLTLAVWYQPARRFLHMRRPRSTSWPPPSSF